MSIDAALALVALLAWLPALRECARLGGPPEGPPRAVRGLAVGSSRDWAPWDLGGGAPTVMWRCSASVAAARVAASRPPRAVPTSVCE